MLFNKIKYAISLFSKKRLTTVVGAWVYYFLASIIPMVFLLITAFGVFGVNFTEELISRLPEEFRAFAKAVSETAENASNGVTIFFVLTVIFSCSSLLNQMSKDGDFIFGETIKRRGLFRRLWAILTLGALFSIFLISALLFAFGKMIFAYFNLGKHAIGVLAMAILALVITLGFFIIILLNKFICPFKIVFKDCYIGSLLSLFIIVIGTIGLTLYLRFFADYNVFYGSLAGIVAFLLWAYLLMMGLVMGVIINAHMLNKKHAEQNCFQRVNGFSI